jgi:hypothetical protein
MVDDALADQAVAQRQNRFRTAATIAGSRIGAMIH